MSGPWKEDFSLKGNGGLSTAMSDNRHLKKRNHLGEKTIQTFLVTIIKK